ncbi:MAG: hypothetical protein RR298_00520, partial [Alistipes sp.]
RRNKRNLVTLDLLRAAGFDPEWKRVRWLGGVGSSHLMRGNILRVLVCSSCSGYSSGSTHSVNYCPGISDFIHIRGKRSGFRYGYCCEIAPL